MLCMNEGTHLKTTILEAPSNITKSARTQKINKAYANKAYIKHSAKLLTASHWYTFFPVPGQWHQSDTPNTKALFLFPVFWSLSTKYHVKQSTDCITYLKKLLSWKKDYAAWRKSRNKRFISLTHAGRRQLIKHGERLLPGEYWTIADPGKNLASVLWITCLRWGLPIPDTFVVNQGLVTFFTF